MISIKGNSENQIEKKELTLKREELPLVIKFKEKKYVLFLTKNDKLILQKPID